ncbi:MAG: hypothetical protein ACI9FW_001472, partial [Flavobacterium sp.]
FFIGQQELVIGLTQEKIISKKHISILKHFFICNKCCCSKLVLILLLKY